MLSPHDLSALIAFADKGSIREAAATLHRTQPAITQAIQRLEEVVGFQLLDRSNYRSILTGRCELFLKRARKTIQESRDLKAYAKVLSLGNEPLIKLVVHGALASRHWLHLLASLPEKFPDTVLEVQTTEGEAPFRQLKQEEADLAVTVGNMSKYAQAFEYRHLGHIDFVNVAHHTLIGSNPEHELAIKPQILVADFDDAKTTYGVVEGQRYWRVSDFRIKVNVITAGLGWGSTPLWMIEEDLEKQRLRPIQYKGVGPQSQHPIYLCRRHGVPLGPVAASIWDHVCP